MSLFNRKYSHNFSKKQIDKSLETLIELQIKLGKHFEEMEIENTKIDESIEDCVNELKSDVGKLTGELNYQRNFVRSQK